MTRQEEIDTMKGYRDMPKYEVEPSSTTCKEGLPEPEPWTFTLVEREFLEDENVEDSEDFNWVCVFECPDCGHHAFEEVKVNVTTVGKVTCVDGTGELDYYGWDTLGGFVARFECENCDYSLVDRHGRTITDPMTLRDYLIAQHRARKDAE